MQGLLAHLRGRSAAADILLRMVLALCAALAATSSARAQTEHPSHIVNIARFTTWPEDADYGLSFRICLRDDDPAFGRFLEVRGQTVGGRPITLHAVPPEALGKRPCHLVYFSRGLADPVVLGALKGKPTLTVSPQPGFAKIGGVIEMAYREGRPELIISKKTVVSHQLTVSAQLLDLAEEVPE
ncbi:YfiR family protein [Parvularcula lutaonensis]|uniref:YfiR family protein n=1 Tax=Parvularcula lutaonensis TaxID=491923 RepID=A0ABV7M8Y1_9PROT|nr:YfiR family protein [Parvularcula lutaonensis]GGY45698.1 hypothetical protein GCM10007148_13400 [Parvularcula lutaonensis]